MYRSLEAIDRMALPNLQELAEREALVTRKSIVTKAFCFSLLQSEAESAR